MKKLLLICVIIQMITISTKAGCSYYMNGNKSMPLNSGDSVMITFGISGNTGPCYIADTLQWYRNDTIIVGANQITYMAKKSGIYKIAAQRTGSPPAFYSVSYTVTYITSTVVPLIDWNKTIILYPNPNNGIFKLSIDNIVVTQRYTIFIYDMLGKVVQKEELTNEGGNIDISTQPKGIYFIKVIGEDRQVKVDKIIYQ